MMPAPGGTMDGGIVKDDGRQGTLPLFGPDQENTRRESPRERTVGVEEVAAKKVVPAYGPVTTAEDVFQRLDEPLSARPGISKKRLALLEKLKLKTIGDCLENYPRAYLDRTKMLPLARAGYADEPVTVTGKVVRHEDVPVRKPKGPKVVRVILYDGEGLAALVGFGRRAGYLKVSLKEGDTVVVTGRFRRNPRRDPKIEATNFEYEVLSDEDAELIHTGRIVPVYRATEGLPQRALRTLMARIVREHADRSPEALPVALRKRFKLIDRADAIRQIHLPDSAEALREAQRRLIFEELFLLQLGLLLRRKRAQIEEAGIAFDTSGERARRLLAGLPFELTDSQRHVLAEIEADMSDPRPMNRLLQGDVGSGKTIVAAVALVHAVESGYQGALMAPTEILAEQHMQGLRPLLEPLGIEPALLKGDLSAADRRDAIERIADGRAQIVVGTHALIQEGVAFSNLGLVITDEQHRFGVLQRQKLRNKGRLPDTLVMTATPIPRTLALTVYGDLSVSVIDELPPGRQPIQTKHFTEGDRDHLYRFMEAQLRKGRQAYVVYPLIEESEKLEDVQAAIDGHAALVARFPDRRIGLLHGRMNGEDKQEAMRRFKAHELDVLVTTTVIEVGVDVPNANLIVIEHADRFGLAQLHQLRGRVGRGPHRSYCALVGWPRSDEAKRRLHVMTRTTSGFEIAEEDLRIRGPGEILGTRQAGLPSLKIADLLRDARVLETARDAAAALVENDPELADPRHASLRQVLLRAWGRRLRLATVG